MIGKVSVDIPAWPGEEYTALFFRSVNLEEGGVGIRSGNPLQIDTETSTMPNQSSLKPYSYEAFPQAGVVAYFSMEIAINPGMPTYSGGLGVLAGDTLRSTA